MAGLALRRIDFRVEQFLNDIGRLKLAQALS
jgi:hypothetical protein